MKAPGWRSRHTPQLLGDVLLRGLREAIGQLVVAVAPVQLRFLSRKVVAHSHQFRVRVLVLHIEGCHSRICFFQSIEDTASVAEEMSRYMLSGFM